MRRISVLFFVALTACAGQNQEAKGPEAEQAADQAAAAERARLTARPSSPPPVALPAMPLETQLPAAEVQAKQAPPGTADKEDPDLAVLRERVTVEAQDNATRAAKDAEMWRREGIKIERYHMDADARDRLARASTRAAQVQTRLSRLAPQRRVEFNTALNAFHNKKSDVQTRINSLTATGNDEWRNARNALDKALDDLDHSVDRLEALLF